MFKSKKIILSAVVICAAILSVAFFVKSSDKEAAIDQMLIQSLNNYHYSPKKLNDDFSEKVFNLYLQRLDYNKKFLIQSDVDELKKMNHLIDDDVNLGKFTFFDKSFDIINKRVEEAEAYYKEILASPFDFTKDESFQLDPEKINYAKDKFALKEEWRKSLKYQTLAKIVDMMDIQEKAKEKSDTVKIKSREELEKEARGKVLKSNDDYFKRIKRFDRDDRIALYFNAITGIYDPHTEFFPPKEKENFDIGMSGYLQGIGAQLQEKDGFIKVANIVPGSPSYKQGQLKTNDIILKVAQGDAEPVDVVDMPLDDAVQLIRGKKGTEVRLTVKKPDASIVVISIIRDIVVMEETYAQSVILQGEKKIGYIKLPSFYNDFSGKTNRACAKDVKEELRKLKEEKVDGVVLDLRYNGGGSLNDVVDMAGLFISKGPICQVKAKDGLPVVLEDKDPSITYDGPLTVMINSNSASASEIMAAAIQDYNRGLIIGTSPSSFGKGTVQRFFDLDQILPPAYSNIGPIGSLKVTIQKFYRINGGTTQLKGVIPDIVLPDPYYFLDQGEKEQDYPMPWDEIKPANYTKISPSYSVEKIKMNSNERVNNNSDFAVLKDAAKRLKKQKDESVVSLNFDKYLAEQKNIKAETKKLESIDKEINGIEVLGLKADAFSDSDTAKVNKNKLWYKALKKDIYLNETISIMNEMK